MKFNPTVFKNILIDTSKYIAINKDDDYTLIYYLLWQFTLKNKQKVLLICDDIEEREKIIDCIINYKFETKLDFFISDVLSEFTLKIRDNEFKIIMSQDLNINMIDNYNIIILPNQLKNFTEKEKLLNNIVKKNQIILRTMFNNENLEYTYLYKHFIKKDTCNVYKHRQYYNKLILNIIQKEIEFNPESRLWQILFNFGVIRATNWQDAVQGFENKDSISKYFIPNIIDDYFLESEKIYNNMISHYKKLQLNCKQIKPNTIYINENNEFVYIKQDFEEQIFINNIPVYTAISINDDNSNYYLVDENGTAYEYPISIYFTTFSSIPEYNIKLGK